MARRPPRLLLALLLGVGCAGGVAIGPVLQRGELALAAGEVEDAADAFQSALALEPGNPRALLGLARSHLARSDGEAALVVFAELRSIAPAYFAAQAAADYELALEQAARSRLWRGDPAGSLRLIALLDPASAAKPGVRALRTRAQLVEAGRLQVAGRDREAAALYRQATGAEPGSDPAAPLAEALIAEGEIDTAISLLSDAARRAPGDPRVAVLLRRALEIRYPDPPPDAPEPPEPAGPDPSGAVE